MHPYNPFVAERFGVRLYADEGTDRASVRIAVDGLGSSFDGIDDYVASWRFFEGSSLQITLDSQIRAVVISGDIARMATDIFDGSGMAAGARD